MIPDPPLAGLEARVRELEQVVAEKVAMTMMMVIMWLRWWWRRRWWGWRWWWSPLFSIQVRTIREQRKMIEAQRGQIQRQTNLQPMSKVINQDSICQLKCEILIKIFQLQLFPGTSSPGGFFGLFGGSGGRQLWGGPVEDKPARRIVISTRKNKRQSNLWSSHAVVQLCFVEDL